MQVVLLGALSLVHTRVLLIGNPRVPWRLPLLPYIPGSEGSVWP